MYKLPKVIFTIFGLVFLFLVSGAFAADTGETELFGMQCTWEKSITTPIGLTAHTGVLYTIQSGTVMQKTASGDVQITQEHDDYRIFKILNKRLFTDIKKMETYRINGAPYLVIMGTRCGQPQIRINAHEYQDKLGIIDIQSDGQSLQLYYQKGSHINLISCNPNTQLVPLVSLVSLDKGKGTPEYSGGRDLLATGRQIQSTLPLYKLVEEFGYDRKTDRVELAKQAGLDIDTYHGTLDQNLQIQKYLLGKITPTPVTPTSTPVITISTGKYEAIKNVKLRQLVGLRGYIWKQDRLSIAKEFGYDELIYYGTRSQNLNIRSQLFDKISIKK